MMLQPQAIYLSDFEQFQRQTKIGLQTLAWIEAGNTPSSAENTNNFCFPMINLDSVLLRVYPRMAVRFLLT